METEKNAPMGRTMLAFHFQLARWTKANIETLFHGKKNSVTIQQFHILMMIHKGGMRTISQMSRFMGLSKSSLSLTVSRMIEDGYLRKEFPEGHEDGWKVYFFVTPKGKEIIKDTMERNIDFFQKFYESLSVEKQQDLETGIALLKNVYCWEEKV